MRTANCDLPLDAVLGSNLHSSADAAHASQHIHFHTQLFRAESAISETDFARWEAALPTFLLRGKGRVTFKESGAHLWQRVGARGTLSRINSDNAGTEIVLIAAQPLDVDPLP